MKLRHTFLVVALAVACATTPAMSHEKPKVTETVPPITALFIGNSFTYYNNSVHDHLRKLIKSVWPEKRKMVLYKSMTISGSYLENHTVSARGMIEDYEDKRKMGAWDVVVLQGQSQEPIEKEKAAAFRDAAAKLDKLVRDSGSRTALFMTWAYQDKPEMAEPLRDAYTKIGNELGAIVVPVGVAFALAQSKDPKVELHAEDKYHPSPLGTYLAANVFFATFFNKSPVGASYTAGLSDEQARFAQETAWEAVQQYFGR